MRRFLLIAASLLLFSCGGREPSVPHPALKASLLENDAVSAVFSLEQTDLAECRYLCVTDEWIETVNENAVLRNGTVAEGSRVQVRALTPDTSYTFFAIGVAEDGTRTPMLRIAFRTGIDAVELTVRSERIGSYEAVFSLETTSVETVRYLLVPPAEADAITEERLVAEGLIVTENLLTLSGLQSGTAYTLLAIGIARNGQRSALVRLSFTTAIGPGQRYEWEEARSSIPFLPDLTLCAGGSAHRNPFAWDAERWASHALYTDESGKEHYLFDAFLLIEGQQTYGNITYALTADYMWSATKEDWEKLLDYWFDGGDFKHEEGGWGPSGRMNTGKILDVHLPDGCLSALESCLEAAAARIGPAPRKRLIVFSIPDPIYFDNYIAAFDGDGGIRPDAKTVYWGEIDGKPLDMSRTEDRVRACCWFMDRVREEFHEKRYHQIELGGFYVLNEELATRPATWRYSYKQDDVVVSQIAAYAHACREGLYWIPYNLAPGYQDWEKLGIDIAYMQPNYYWNPEKKPLRKTFDEITRLGMGLELEFEYSMVEDIAGASQAALYRSRFDPYLDWAVSSGVYGTRSIALYSGTDALHQLASSALPADRAQYHRLCRFILDSPLKK